MLEQLAMAQVLERWRVELGRAGMVAPDPAEASEVDIAALENRLGRQLPPSYREFLATSNGWPITGTFTAGLRSADRVGWFRDLEREWLEIWRDCAGDIDNPDVELMDRALLVSEPGEEALLLDGDDVDPVTGEWACWTLSNFAESRQVGRSFRAGMEYVYRDFLASHPVPSTTRDEAEQEVANAYQAMLAGDLTARDRLDDVICMSWRAWLLAAQFDAFAPRGDRDMSTSVQHLWWGNLGAVSQDEALADPVLMEDLLPLWVVRLVEAGLNVDFEVQRAPAPVAETMQRLLAQIAAGTGPVADFSYTPAFAARIEAARREAAVGPADTGWQIVEAALPDWTPRSGNHLAPLGLYWDKDLRLLLQQPPPRRQTVHHVPVAGSGDVGVSERGVVITQIVTQGSPPATTTASITRLPSWLRSSDRALTVLRTEFGRRPTAE